MGVVKGMVWGHRLVCVWRVWGVQCVPTFLVVEPTFLVVEPTFLVAEPTS